MLFYNRKPTENKKPVQIHLPLFQQQTIEETMDVTEQT